MTSLVALPNALAIAVKGCRATLQEPPAQDDQQAEVEETREDEPRQTVRMVSAVNYMYGESVR